MYILLVENEEQAGFGLKRRLAEIGIKADVANNGIDGLAMAEKHEYDVIALEVTLPGINGWEVLRRLRSAGRNTPVIFVTVLDSVQDRVAGLQRGADDYLVKPFAFSEFVARIQCLARRGRDIRLDVVRVADLEVNFFAHKATRGGLHLELTPKEFALLSLFIRRSGEALSRSRIAERIWNLGVDSNLKIVDVKVGNLRAKVDDPYAKKLIHTVRGIGYVLEDRGNTL